MNGLLTARKSIRRHSGVNKPTRIKPINLIEKNPHKLVICWLSVGPCGEKVTSSLKMLAPTSGSILKTSVIVFNFFAWLVQ